MANLSGTAAALAICLPRIRGARFGRTVYSRGALAIRYFILLSPELWVLRLNPLAVHYSMYIIKEPPKNGSDWPWGVRTSAQLFP